jgi:cobalt-precorrin-5B (C1)-methyltransferase
VEQALADLGATDPGRAERLRQRVAAAIEQRSLDYLARYGQVGMAVGAVLFDRSRQLCAQGPVGRPLFAELAGVGRAELDGGGT